MNDKGKLNAIRRELAAESEYNSLEEALVTLSRIAAIVNDGESSENEPYRTRTYCPECGTRLKQGDREYNYESGITDYTCPNCSWGGIEPINEEKIISDLEKSFDEGIEITTEDAELVMKRLEEGYDYKDAIEEIATGIMLLINEPD